MAKRPPKPLKKILTELKHRYYGYRSRELFEQVEHFCLFLGYPRSGHTVVAAVIDAHTDAVLSMGGHLSDWVEKGFSRNHIYATVIERAKAFSNDGATNAGYHYRIDQQWQGGRYRKLKVVGDKRAGETARKFGANPQLLERLRRTVGGPIKIVHIVRNPYDNIATISRRHNMPLNEAVAYYFSMADSVRNLMPKLGREELITMHHEEIISQPTIEFRRLLEFLCLEVDTDYLERCAKLVYNKPNQSRHQADWTLELKNAVAEQVGKYPYLSHYHFDI